MIKGYKKQFDNFPETRKSYFSAKKTIDYLVGSRSNSIFFYLSQNLLTILASQRKPTAIGEASMDLNLGLEKKIPQNRMAEKFHSEP